VRDGAQTRAGGILDAYIAVPAALKNRRSGSQVATLFRAEGRDARAAGDEGQKIVEHAPISMGLEAQITEGASLGHE
jgi:hypothetical protein